MTTSSLEATNAASHGDPKNFTTELRRWAWIPLLVVALSTVGASWALSSPIGSSPDDDFHLASIWCSPFAPDELCKPTEQLAADLDANMQGQLDGGVKLVRVPSRVGQEALCFAFDPTVSASCQRETVTEGFTETRANDGLYPNGLYTLFGVFVTSDAGRSVIVIRMVSFALSMGLIVAAAAAVGRSLRQSYTLAVLATSIPLGVFLFSSTNPSGVAVASVGSAFVCALGFLRSTSRRETTAVSLVGVTAVGLAVSSRADTGLYVAAACGCALIFERAWRRQFWVRSMVLVVVALVGLISLMLSTQTSAATDGIGGTDGLQPLSALLWNNLLTLPALWVGSLGVGWGLGWLDTRLPDVVGMSMVAAAGGLLLWGLGDVRRSKLVAALAAVITISFVPMWILAADRRLVGESVQPRYLLPMLPVLVTICLLPAQRGLRRLDRTQFVVLGCAFALAQSIALHANIRRYVSGQELIGLDLNSQVEWWWPIGVSPMALWLIGSAAFAIVVVIALAKTTVDVHVTVEGIEGGTCEDHLVDSTNLSEVSASEDQDILPIEWDGEVAGPRSESNGSPELEPSRSDERAK